MAQRLRAEQSGYRKPLDVACMGESAYRRGWLVSSGRGGTKKGLLAPGAVVWYRHGCLVDPPIVARCGRVLVVSWFVVRWLVG